MLNNLYMVSFRQLSHVWMALVSAGQFSTLGRGDKRRGNFLGSKIAFYDLVRLHIFFGQRSENPFSSLGIFVPSSPEILSLFSHVYPFLTSETRMYNSQCVMSNLKANLTGFFPFISFLRVQFYNFTTLSFLERRQFFVVFSSLSWEGSVWKESGIKNISRKCHIFLQQ